MGKQQYTVRDWVSEIAMRAMAEAITTGNHHVVAELVTAMSLADLVDDREIRNPKAARAVLRQERQEEATSPTGSASFPRLDSWDEGALPVRSDDGRSGGG